MELASITSTLAPLAVLACPLAMGAMMWVMMRGNRKQDQPPHQTPSEPPSLEVLREEHNRLSEEIDRLERREAASADPPERR